MLSERWSRMIAAAALWRWRNRVDVGHFVRPDEQHGAGRMIDDKARRRAEAVRPQAGAVAVTGCHQQVGRLGGLHDLPLDPSSANHLADIGSPQQPGTSRDQSLPRRRRFGLHLLCQTRLWPRPPAPDQPLGRSAGCVEQVLGHHVEKRDPGILGDQRRGSINAALPRSFGQPQHHVHG